MLQIGICDDMSEVRLKLHVLLERLLEIKSVRCQIFEFSSGEGLLNWCSKHAGELDLVFLDIEMGGINGMETAKLLRKQDSNLQIVFVTGYTDYVFDGYSVSALGYIMKPAKAEQLEEVLQRAMGALHQQEPEFFMCKNGESHYRIQKNTIDYFQSNGRQVICVADDHRYVFYAKLDQVENDVGEGFVRIHQRYLVRAGAVGSIESSKLTVNGETLPISRAYSQSAMVALTRSTFF